MSVTTEDVQEWVKLTWNANGTLSALSLVAGFQPESTTASRYAEFRVQDGQTQINAGSAYLQDFTVEFRVWSESGAADLGPYKRAMEAAFKLLARMEVPLPSSRTLGILHSHKAPGNIEEDQQTQRGKSVMVSLDRFNVFCQG